MDPRLHVSVIEHVLALRIAAPAQASIQHLTIYAFVDWTCLIYACAYITSFGRFAHNTLQPVEHLPCYPGHKDLPAPGPCYRGRITAYRTFPFLLTLT